MAGHASPLMRLSVSVTSLGSRPNVVGRIWTVNISLLCFLGGRKTHYSMCKSCRGYLVSGVFRIRGVQNWRETVFAQPPPASPPLKAKISLLPRQMQQRARSALASSTPPSLAHLIRPPQFGARCALCRPTRCYFVCGTRIMGLQTKFGKTEEEEEEENKRRRPRCC